MKKTALYLFLFCLLCALPACKIYSFTGASIAPDIKTVQVDLFENKANAGPAYLNQNFTTKLRLKMVTEANLKQVSSGGDLKYSGYISSYSVTSQAPTAQNLSGVNRLRITVHLVFENTKNETENSESDLEKYADYSGSENLINIESGLIEEINKQLVDDVFNKTIAKW